MTGLARTALGVVALFHSVSEETITRPETVQGSISQSDGAGPRIVHGKHGFGTRPKGWKVSAKRDQAN